MDFIELIKFIGAIRFHVFKGSEASELPENQSNKNLLSSQGPEEFRVNK